VDIPGATEAALVARQPGLYKVIATSGGASTPSPPAMVSEAVGNAAFAPDSPRLVNVSLRTRVAVDAPVAIAGFALAGATAKTVLIRAIGPGLSALGVEGALADPQLQLFAGAALLYENDNWGGSALLASTGAAVGAFPIPDPASKDSMIVVTLPPGAYTAQVRGVQNTTGTVLVEIYEVPQGNDAATSPPGQLDEPSRLPPAH
jgi:hypothetical protein